MIYYFLTHKFKSTINYISFNLPFLYKVGSNIRIGISTTETPISFTYVVFGRGRLVFAETLKGSGTTYNEINFRASATGKERIIL